jgi:hypothetical protein
VEGENVGIRDGLSDGVKVGDGVGIVVGAKVRVLTTPRESISASNFP